jgi:peptidyl-tRNA hydrolase, PTH1 family
MSKFLIVGLGNIGNEYANTRHNIGFDVVHAFATKHSATFESGKHAFVASVKFKGKPVVCVLPTTYMNLSGKAFKYWLDKEKINIANTITVVDELALPLEKIRIRASGSAGGHNGLKDIEASLGHNAYPKLRFGIGNNYAKGLQADFVLGKWTAQEKPLVQQKINICVDAIETFIVAGIEQTMTIFNNISVS